MILLVHVFVLYHFSISNNMDLSEICRTTLNIMSVCLASNGQLSVHYQSDSPTNPLFLFFSFLFFSFLHFILFCLFFPWVSGGGADSNGDTHVNDMSS